MRHQAQAEVDDSLDLAIVERVLLRHDAELQVRNLEGGGLPFQISLPAV